MNYETIILIAFISIGIAAVGCMLADWILRRLNRRKTVIPYASINDCKPAAFMTVPRDGD
jgi:hypothetical protein